MPHASTTSPDRDGFADWTDLADAMVARLRRHHQAASGHPARLPRKLGRSDAEILFEQFRTGDAAMGDPDHVGLMDAPPPSAPPPPPHVPTRQLLGALRLAKTFGTQAVLDTAQGRGALTIIERIAAEDLQTLHDVLQICYPDSRWQLIAPDAIEGSITKAAQQRFEAAITDGLDCHAPIVILHAAGSALPKALQSIAPATLAPTTLTLAPISREIIVALLRSGPLAEHITDPDDLLDTLPDDASLARLDTMSICTALRAPDLNAALARLNAMASGTAVSGPRLEDLAGDSAVLLAARRMVDDLHLWQRGEVGWHEISRSLLLYGPPGTGKTWLARAMGRSAGIACVTATFAQWQAAGHLGHMLREMAASFAEARQQAPCILFIDEIDAVGSRTDGDGHAINYRTQVINAFLGEMNQIAAQEGVIVVGACNHPQRIDPAVLRAGRFDLKIEVPLPDHDYLLAVLRQQLSGEIDDDALQALARRAIGRSLADLDAAIRAARSDTRHGGTRLTIALIASHLGISAETEDRAYLWRIAVHEAGHALIGAALDLGATHRMWISAEGGQISREAVPSQSRLSDIEAEIGYFLGGRAAERLILGEVSAGAGGPASSDLAAATRHAIMIETSYGLGIEGPVWHAHPDEAHLATPAIRDRVRQRLTHAERRAREILTRHRQTLDGLAAELLEQRSLRAVDMEPWLQRVRPRQDAPGHRDDDQIEDKMRVASG